MAVVVGVYGALDPGSLPAGGTPILAGGAVFVAAGMAVGGRRRVRSRYRPDLWRGPEWMVVASGAAALAGLIVAGALDPNALQLILYPLTVPSLPLVAVAGILVAARRPRSSCPPPPLPPSRLRRQRRPDPPPPRTPAGAPRPSR